MKENEFKIIQDTQRLPGTAIQKDGIHFGYYAQGKVAPVLLLYHAGTEEIAERIPFPASDWGDNYYSMKIKISPSKYEYNFLDDGQVVVDPYACVVHGREEFGAPLSASKHSLRGGFSFGNFDWENDQLPKLSVQDCVMYHLHLRGFSMMKNSGVRKKGTFAGLKEKIPYFKEMGINQLKLMPIYEFSDMVPKSAAYPSYLGIPKEAAAQRNAEKQSVEASLNYWGYGDAYYFAPKKAYSYGKNPVLELKDLVKALHKEGIELIPEFSFSDQTDIETIVRCLYYWADTYHVDGFSVIARESVRREISRLSLFSTRKLISEWYPDDARRLNTKENHRLLLQSNDGFMNDCRRFLRGDDNSIEAFSYRIRANSPVCGEVNYITNHDGFTLMDLVSYDHKYNLANGEGNRDGSDYNLSWNCGVEGPTKKKAIQELRMRQRKNAFAMLLFSQGIPMILAGDEFGNTQNGNNNPYCHDNELTWLDWRKNRQSAELQEFVKQAICYRKNHKVLHQRREISCTDQLSCGFPDLSFHGERAWYGGFHENYRHLGCLYCGDYAGEAAAIYLAFNFSSDSQEFALPQIKNGKKWKIVMDTSQQDSFLSEENQQMIEKVKVFSVPARTVMILEGN